MTPEFAYLLKVNIAFALFYAFYRLSFYRDTFFKLRRAILLAFFVLAIVYPFVNLQSWIHSNDIISNMVYTYSQLAISETVVDSNEAGAFRWGSFIQGGLFLLYVVAVAVLAVRFFIRIGCIWWLARKSKRCMVSGVEVYALAHPAGPFSFFNYIFIHPASHTEMEMKEIILHEQTHANQWHSVDVVVGEWFAIFCWFNPFVWLLRREVRHNLEYLADHRVIQSGFDSRNYQYHLLGLAHSHPKEAELCNSFNVLHLKNRIFMMNRKRSSKMARMKYAFIFPLFFLLVGLNSMAIMARIGHEMTTAGALSLIAEVTSSESQTAQPNDGILVQVATEQPPVSAALKRKSASNTSAVKTPAGNSFADRIGSLPTDFTPATTPEETASVSQTPAAVSTETPPPFTVVEKMPMFPGGEQGLISFLARSVKYPVEAQRNGKQGRVICGFVVNSDGSIVDAEVLRSVDPDLDREALRVISTFPKWTPGRQSGENVRVRFVLPITFKLA